MLQETGLDGNTISEHPGSVDGLSGRGKGGDAEGVAELAEKPCPFQPTWIGTTSTDTSKACSPPPRNTPLIGLTSP